MNALELFVNHRQILKDDLNSFIEHYDGVQVKEISSLADKIEHMCVYIGSPSSVLPMLKAICKNKINIWPNRYDHNHQPETKLNKMMGTGELTRKFQDPKSGTLDVIRGHFRWNHGAAYTFDRDTLDYIKAWFIDDTFDRTQAVVYNTRFNIRYAKGAQINDTTYAVEITTVNDNSYRFVYYHDTQSYSCNLGNGDVTPQERKYVRNILQQDTNLQFRL